MAYLEHLSLSKPCVLILQTLRAVVNKKKKWKGIGISSSYSETDTWRGCRGAGGRRASHPPHFWWQEWEPPSELMSQAPFIATEEKQALLRHDSCALFTCLL